MRPSTLVPFRPGATFATLAIGLVLAAARSPEPLAGQGVTTAGIRGFVTSDRGEPLEGANITATHVPSGVTYSTVSRAAGAYTIPNMRVGGPYTVRVTLIGYEPAEQQDIFLSLGTDFQQSFELATRAIEVEGITVTLEEDKVLSGDRTGAATFIDLRQVEQLPSVKRSTRDLIRLDPRSDGNYAFAGRNWLFNNVSLDGSYFNNPFGLDDPAPGGQTAAEPVPYDAVEQVQVSVASFDVREGGFTGANVNTVTKSGTNEFRASAYTFYRNEDFIGNDVSGQPVIANPDLSFNQSGVTFSGPIVPDRLFFFVNGEIERRDDPGTNFVAGSGGSSVFGESRVEASVMDAIRQRMIDVYGYDPGPYDGFVHETDNDKLIAKLDWNVNEHNNATLRYNYLDASRDLPPHPFVLSFNATGRGPNSTSLPFRNAGYAINNQLHSVAFELNTLQTGWANRFFASYNRFRDHRDPFSEPFPTIEIGEGGVTYTTLGHEPFSIHNILDQDVLQLTNNFSLFRGRHVLTFGANFEYFGFFNSFNIFRHGVFFLPDETGIGTTFDSLDEFFEKTDPASPDFIDFRNLIGTGPFKGENIDVGQLSFYGQDELALSDRFNLTLGLRVDFPMYFNDPVDNPFSRGLMALDESDRPETVDQSDLPGATPLLSPRVGFNWDVNGDRSTQLRGGTGIFTGRVPFVWVGNVISNPGANPNLYPGIAESEVPEEHRTSDDAILQQSFDLNAMDPDFKWPQTWVTDIAVDQRLPWEVLGTLEVIYGKDLNGIFMRNADLVEPVRTLPDGRPYFGGAGNNELNPDGGAGIYVIDNTSDGYNLSLTGQLRKNFDFGLGTIVSYAFTEAKNKLKSTEIASVLWQEQPVRGDPNDPETSYSEFGQRHRIVGAATYAVEWNEHLATQIGLFFEAAEGNRFGGAGGNRYSFIYSGDVNGDGFSNDLIHIPASQDEIRFDAFVDPSGATVTPEQQWGRLDAFIEQDRYLSKHRGEIAERFGLLNPWYETIDLRVLQDIGFDAGGKRHRLQVNLDIQNLANLLNSDWGVRQVASPAATSPLRLVRFDDDGAPVFNFTGPSETFIDDPGIFSRWQLQLGVRYLFN